MSYDSHSGQTMWDYLVGRASTEKPMLINFYDPANNRLYRDVHLNVLGAHGWELINTLLAVNEGGSKTVLYYFKRPRDETQGPIAADLDVT